MLKSKQIFVQFVKKYFIKVINAKKEIDSIIGFSFVLIGIYLIPAGLILNWYSIKISLLFCFYLLFLFYFNDDVKTTGMKKLLDRPTKWGGKASAKIINAQKWECCETGYVSTAAGVVSYQKGKGIDTSKNNRRRIA